MENPFAQKMASLSNAELETVVLNRPDYVPLALAAAERELLQRGMPPSTLDILREEAGQKEEEYLQIAEEPLEFSYKLGYFFLSFLTFTPFVFIFYRYWDDKGFRRKSVEATQNTFLGLLFYYAVYMVLTRIVLA